MHAIPIDYVRSANRDAGGHFFDADTMRHFDSRIESSEAFVNQATLEAFFVTSERTGFGTPRHYKVRRFDDQTGRIMTAAPQPFLTASEALACARSLAEQSPVAH